MAAPVLGLDHLSVLGMPPAAFVSLAAAAGFDEVSLFAHRLDINPFGYPDWSLVADKDLRRDVRIALADLGMELALGEGCTILPGSDVGRHEPVLDMFAELGARRINIVSFENDVARDFDQSCKLAELATARGLKLCAEFSARPGRSGFAEFMRRAADMPGGGVGVLIDAMHFFRAGTAVAALTAVDPSRIVHLQLCDIGLDAVRDYMEAAMHERLVPGDGSLALEALVGALPADLPISLELPQKRLTLSGVGQAERLMRAAAVSRALIGRARARR